MRGQDRPRLMRRGRCFLVAALLLMAFSAGAGAQKLPEAPRLTGPIPPTKPVDPPPVPRTVTDDVRRMRNYPEQPPIIPHSIEGYQLTLRTNRCLSCHSRQYIEG